jgi:hypothetical protein
MNGTFLGTLKPLIHSSQNRYLDGVDVTPNSCFGKRQSSTGVHNADAKMRLQNTAPDALTWVACFNFMIQSRPS